MPDLLKLKEAVRDVYAVSGLDGCVRNRGMGTCVECDGRTSSSSLKLCRRCAKARLDQALLALDQELEDEALDSKFNRDMYDA